MQEGGGLSHLAQIVSDVHDKTTGWTAALPVTSF